MTKTSKTIVFFGNERLATGVSTDAPTLRRLIAAGYHIAAIVSHYSHGQSRNARPLEVSDIAAEYNIPVLLPDRLSDIRDTLASSNAIAGVLVAYGKMVPESIINLFPRGIVNIHPSRLPAYRGPTPIESVILEHEPETAVSLMQLAKEMDAGPLYAQQSIKLTGSESKQDLANTLLSIGGDLLQHHLPNILEGRLTPTPQSDTSATYCSLIMKSDGHIDWHKPSQRIADEIRAYAGWPGSRTTLGTIEVIITRSHIDTVACHDQPGKVTVLSPDSFAVQAGDGHRLVVDELKPLGKNNMTARSFLAGYRQKISDS